MENVHSKIHARCEREVSLVSSMTMSMLESWQHQDADAGSGPRVESSRAGRSRMVPHKPRDDVQYCPLLLLLLPRG